MPNGTQADRGVVWSKLLYPLGVALLGSSVVGLSALFVWKGSVDTQLSGREETRKDVTTALTVLGDHGTEFELIRRQLENIRGQLGATRTELLDALKLMSSDRFRGADWDRESRLIEEKLARMQDSIDRVGKDVEDLKKRK